MTSEPDLPNPAVTVVRRHPEMYLARGRFDVGEVLSLIVTEAIRGGAERVGFGAHGQWLAVIADVDWLAGSEAAFYAPLSYAEGGRNSARAEVLLTAFCPTVVTGRGSRVVTISGAVDAGADDAHFRDWASRGARFVAFEPPTEARMQIGDADVAEVRELPHRFVQSAVSSYVEKLDAWAS